MLPPVLVLAGFGLICLALGRLVVRSFGEALRIGRLLSAAPEVSLSEARESAERGERVYVRVRGRIDADAPFSDEHGRPLVLRRERVDVLEGSRWRTLQQARRDVPFVLRDRATEIGIDAAALDEGLVVLPRESVGSAGQITELISGPVDPALVVRFRIDQVSAVEHAYAVGMPQRGPDGDVRLGPGRDRPLILTTLEIPEAMRMLAQGRRQRATIAAGLLTVGLACVALALVVAVVALALPGNVLGSSPQPTIAPGGDTRSSGGGPGLVGQPFTILAGVIALGLLSAGLAMLYARFWAGRRGR